jgi:hypothetical protein
MIYVFALTVLALGFLLAPRGSRSGGVEPNAAPVKQNDGRRDLADDIAECDPQSSASI